MPNFFAGPMRINLSLNLFDDLPVTTDDPIVDLNPWQVQVISVGGHPLAMPELTFVNTGTSHVLHWTSAPVDPARRAALWLALVTRNMIWIRIGYDLQQSADLSIRLQPITVSLAQPPGAPSEALSFRVVEADLRLRLTEVKSYALVAERAPREEPLFTFEPDGSLRLGAAEVLAPLRQADSVTLEVASPDKPGAVQRVRVKLATRHC
jgi:hypothetical protein